MDINALAVVSCKAGEGGGGGCILNYTLFFTIDLQMLSMTGELERLHAEQRNEMFHMKKDTNRDLALLDERKDAAITDIRTALLAYKNAIDNDKDRFESRMQDMLEKATNSWTTILVRTCIYLDIHFQLCIIGWLVVLRIYVALVIFKPYRDLEAEDTSSQSLNSQRRDCELKLRPLAPQAKGLTTTPSLLLGSYRATLLVNKEGVTLILLLSLEILPNNRNLSKLGINPFSASGSQNMLLFRSKITRSV